MLSIAQASHDYLPDSQRGSIADDVLMLELGDQYTIDEDVSEFGA